MLSYCCDAPPLGEVYGEGEDSDGMCSRCYEHSSFYNEDEEE